MFSADCWPIRDKVMVRGPTSAEAWELGSTVCGVPSGLVFRSSSSRPPARELDPRPRCSVSTHALIDCTWCLLHDPGPCSRHLAGTGRERFSAASQPIPDVADHVGPASGPPSLLRSPLSPLSGPQSWASPPRARPGAGSPQPLAGAWSSSDSGAYQAQRGAAAIYSPSSSYSYGSVQTQMGYQVVDVPVTTMVKQVNSHTACSKQNSPRSSRGTFGEHGRVSLTAVCCA